MSQEDVFIVSAVRTPIGSFLGAVSELSAPQLGAAAIRAALQRAQLEAAKVDQVYMGNVLSAGVGQAPARQAAIHAGVPNSVPAVTVSKVCGSGLEALILATRTIRLGDASVVVAGGMESMSQAPYLLPRARTGYRMGHGQVVDSMINDGLWDAYDNLHMGQAAERCAAELGISREAQDAFAQGSYERARASQSTGAFAQEITPVSVQTRRGEQVVTRDEEPGRTDLAKLASLKPAFQTPGTITAGNASKINDGAAALVLASAAACKAHGLRPLARVVSYANHAQAPVEFPTAPVKAIAGALQRAQLKAADVELFEINEAFAVVALACTKLAGLDAARVNVRGGAVALGHPIGASGARIVTTLLYAMKERSARRGLASLCIGGGEANALIIELVERV
jgi:acetyl-CoA C-acetyltransferase